jgi:hypothetical protein
MKTNFIVALATVSLMSGAVIAQEANRPAGEPPRGDAKPGPPPPEQVRRPDGAKPEERRESPPADRGARDQERPRGGDQDRKHDGPPRAEGGRPPQASASKEERMRHVHEAVAAIDGRRNGGRRPSRG